MNKFILYFLIATCLFPLASKAQFETFKDSVVQLYGVVMTADSLQGIPAVSVTIKGTTRGTITNHQGVFSIVALNMFISPRTKDEIVSEFGSKSVSVGLASLGRYESRKVSVHSFASAACKCC